MGGVRLAGDYVVRRGSNSPNGRGRLEEGPQLMDSVVKDSLRLSTHYGLMDPTHKSAAFVSPQSTVYGLKSLLRHFLCKVSPLGFMCSLSAPRKTL